MLITSILEPKVTIRQGLNVTDFAITFGSMVKDDEKTAFAQRLHEVCADMGMPERGRQTKLGKMFHVTAKAARKRLTGEGYPEIELCVQIAREAKVNFEWLMTGRGPKRGATIDTKALVLGEAIDAMPEAMREQVLDYFRYKIETNSNSFIAQEQVARYVVAINAYKVKH